MAFSFALFAALCIAQGFAYQPSDASRGQDVLCKNPAFEIPYEFEETVHEMDEVRESVSMAAMDAYANGDDFKVIIACFQEQKPNFVKLGERISGMIRDASQELAGKLGAKAEKYAKLMEVPMRNIAVTIRALPDRVYNFIKNKEFNKALEAMKEARAVIEKNSRIIGEIIQKMATEVPEVAERAQELARQIRSEARKGSAAISQAFRKCVEEGGPKKTTNFSEEDSS